MKNDIDFRWLGVCGIELTFGKTRILVDPYFTRVKAQFLWFGRPVSNSKVIRKHIHGADHIFITHSHFDHLLDVAEILSQTGAIAHGSPNTVELLRRNGTPSWQVKLIHPNEKHRFGPFEIEALEAGLHSPPGYGPGKLAHNYRLPMKVCDYVMDTVMAFKIQVAGLRILFEHNLHPAEALPVDVLFLEPYAGVKRSSHAQYTRIIKDFRPSIVIPVHTDDMMMSLDQPVLGQILPQRKVFFPLGRFNFHKFKQTIESIRPQTHVFLPNRLEIYRLNEVMAASQTRGFEPPSFASIKIGILHFALRNLAFLRKQSGF
jgi:L-ascorbate metabolism protein UlaG (beta-lactamase superfamily)